jgi:hypothetical protein
MEELKSLVATWRGYAQDAWMNDLQARVYEACANELEATYAAPRTEEN